MAQINKFSAKLRTWIPQKLVRLKILLSQGITENTQMLSNEAWAPARSGPCTHARQPFDTGKGCRDLPRAPWIAKTFQPNCGWFSDLCTGLWGGLRRHVTKSSWG